MTRRPPALITVAIALLAASCASPAREVPMKKPAPAAVKAAKKPPVRLNGRGEVSSVSLADLFALQQSGQVLLYDARPRFFYALGHIAGAISLPKADGVAQIEKREAEIKAALAAKKTIVVYCTNFACPDARTVAIQLSSFGYPSSTLSGGWESWKEAGLPTE
jgi:rhodanese-related sulfurtransferase